jgi:hypothetical protein
VTVAFGSNAPRTDELTRLVDNAGFRVVELVSDRPHDSRNHDRTVDERRKARKAARRAERERERGPGGLQRWRRQATGGSTTPFGLITLALVATGIEAASMVPYLGAMRILAVSDLSLLESSVG